MRVLFKSYDDTGKEREKSFIANCETSSQIEIYLNKSLLSKICFWEHKKKTKKKIAKIIRKIFTLEIKTYVPSSSPFLSYIQISVRAALEGSERKREGERDSKYSTFAPVL